MAATDKDVSITVSNRTITVQIAFQGTRGYQPTDATVTVTGPLPGGQTDDLTGKGTPTLGGAQFVDTVQQDGQYAVNVLCSGKTFGDTVTVPPPAPNPTVSTFAYREPSS
jgi:hypothetical protein